MADKLTYDEKLIARGILVRSKSNMGEHLKVTADFSPDFFVQILDSYYPKNIVKYTLPLLVDGTASEFSDKQDEVDAIYASLKAKLLTHSAEELQSLFINDFPDTSSIYS